MRSSLLVLVGLVVTAAAPAAAQTEPPVLSAAETAAACAPPVAPRSAKHALRVLGSQDVLPRTTFDDRDLLVVNGGTSAGVQIGSRFFVRRQSYFGMRRPYDAPVDVITDAWIQVIAANEATAIARVEHLCGAIFVDDYLEPFEVPHLPANADGSGPAGAPDFSKMARVVTGLDGHRTIVAGEFVIIDHGAEQGIEPGTKLSLYRDIVVVRPYSSMILSAEQGVPLTWIGEAVVVSADGSKSQAKVLRTRDGVWDGDYAVLRR